MKLNTGKCKLIVAGRKDHPVNVKVGESVIEEQNQVELLGALIDNKLTFRAHLNKKVKKANNKLAVIKRNQSYMSIHQKKILLSSFVHSQLSYAPLVWMFHKKYFNKSINKVQERALRLLYTDYTSSFNELLERDGSYTTHVRNIQILLTEMFKAKNKLDPSLLRDIFQESNYEGPTLRNSKYFARPNVNTHKYGKRSLFGVILWEQLPKDIQNEESLSTFKNFIKTWKPTKCPCELCSTNLEGVGRVNLCECNNCH